MEWEGGGGGRGLNHCMIGQVSWYEPLVWSGEERHDGCYKKICCPKL